MSKLSRRGVWWEVHDEDGKLLSRTRTKPVETTMLKTDLKDFIYALSPDVDSNWTKKGDIRMSVVEAVYGKETTKADVVAAVGEYNRDAAIAMRKGE